MSNNDWINIVDKNSGSDSYLRGRNPVALLNTKKWRSVVLTVPLSIRDSDNDMYNWENEIFNWIDDNGYYCVTDNNTPDYQIRFWFTTKDEATAFKLRWT